MSVGLLISVDPEAIEVSKPPGLTLDQVALFSNCLITVNPENLTTRLQFLRKNFKKLAIYLDVRRLKSWTDVTEVLNCGASKIFVTFEQLKVLAQEPTISPGRLVLTVSNVNPQTDIAKLKAFLDDNPQWKSSEWAFDGGMNNEYVDNVLQELENYPPSADQTIYVTPTSQTAGRDLLSQYPGNSLIVSSERLTITPTKEKHEELIPATDLFLAGATNDRKTGLYPTSVVDERGVALGLVYSNKESIAEALKTGAGVYHSRKRGLWHKGASSGDTQELINVGFDCDKDCLVFRVRQKGRGFCHLATMSCWGPVTGLSRLQRTLQERKQDAPEGSYTARLFNDPKLVNAKIKEEADELCAATTKEDIASEAADLLYFALARCVAADVSLEDIESNLDLKSLKVKRRKGDAKPQYVDETPPPEKANGINGDSQSQDEEVKQAASVPKDSSDPAGTNDQGRIQMKRFSTSQAFSDDILQTALQRPSQKSNEKIMSLVQPIISDVRSKGDSAILKYTHQFRESYVP